MGTVSDEVACGQVTPGQTIRDLRSKIRYHQKRQRKFENDKAKTPGSPEHHEIMDAVRAAWDAYDADVIRRARSKEAEPCES